MRRITLRLIAFPLSAKLLRSRVEGAHEPARNRGGTPSADQDVLLKIFLQVAGMVTAVFGLLALLGWGFGWPLLASFGAGRIPMAPSTALLFLLYGAAIGLRARTPFGFSVALASSGMLVALLLFTLSWQHILWAGEHLGLNITGMVDGTPIGHMSPVTACCFLLAGLSFLASLSQSAIRPWRVHLALVSSGVLLATSFVFLMAYSFGTPLLYGSTFIPPALNTILAFSTLGLALLALAGPVGLFRGSPGDEAKPGLIFVLIFFLLALGIAGTGYAYYRNYERQFRAAAERQLFSIAELKVGELSQYRRERLGDAAIFQNNTAFTHLVRRFLASPTDVDAQRQLQVWLGKYQNHFQYDQSRLLDAQGITRLSAPAGLAPVSAAVARGAAEAQRSGQVMFQDFYHNEHDQRVYLGVLIPLFDEADSNRPLGVIVLRIDPATYLYPFIRLWPVPSETAETLLIRREGNKAVFLNELRFQANTALTLRSSFADINMPAVMAALGQEGIVTGRDYRGVPVLAALRAVPDSPWFLVARRDEAEVYAPLRADLWRVVALVGALLFGAGAGLGVVWRQQSIRFYRKQAEVAEALQRTQALLVQAEKLGRVGGWEIEIETGQVTWTEMVYDIHELDRTCQLTVEMGVNFYTPESLPIIEQAVKRAIEQGESFDVELEIITAKGNRRSVHSVGLADLPSRRVVGFFQDITERKKADEVLRQSRRAALNLMTDAIEARDLAEQAEQALRTSEASYKRLFNEMQNGFAHNEIICDAQGRPINSRYLAVNPAFERITGKKAEDVVGRTILEVFPALEPSWIETFGRVALTGESVNFEQQSAELGITFEVSAFCPAPNQYACTFTDITERKAAEAEQQSLLEQIERDRRALVNSLEDQRRTEETLRESEARFRRAITGAPFPIMIHAEDGQVVTINTPWARLTGYEYSDISTIADWTRKAYGTQMDPVRADIDRLYALDGPKAEGEYTITTRSGDTRTWDFSSAPIGQLPDGRRLVISMAMDVTERKKIELERQKFFLLAESSSEFIGMCDLDMNPLYVNPVGRRMVGLPDMEAACRIKVQDYFFPEDQRFIAEEFFPCVLRKGEGDVEIRLRHFQTGQPIWMFYYLFRVCDGDGMPVGWATVSRDITERRQNEQSLRAYTERLKNLHQIDQAILQAIDSPEAITQRAILDLRDLLQCQRVSVGMFDFERNEARVFAATGDVNSVVQIGRDLPDELYGDQDILRQNRLEIIEDNSSTETIQAEGSRSCINAPISSSNGLIGVLSVGWDAPRTITSEEQEITSEVANQIAIAIEQARLLQETKRHAEELEQTVCLRTAQLHAANQELEAFSYSVSHDLRAPLRHISGYVDLLNNRFKEALPEKAVHYLNEVSDSVRQMGTLIDDLLQFSRTGRQELQHADMDMQAVVQEVFEKLKVDTENRKISWSCAKLPRVVGDCALLKQVWINLLENAVKYTQHKDQAKITVGFNREPDHWVFFVQDNGAGFDMRYAQKLFGVFQRLHSQAEFEGTGIGLANVQRIVHKHGGRVWAEAELDKGATFYFTLPCVNPDKEGKSCLN